MAWALVLPQPAERDWLYLVENTLLSSVPEVLRELAKFAAVARETYRETQPVPRPVCAAAAVLSSAGGDVICPQVRCKWEQRFFPPSSEGRLLFVSGFADPFCE